MENFFIKKIQILPDLSKFLFKIFGFFKKFFAQNSFDQMFWSNMCFYGFFNLSNIRCFCSSLYVCVSGSIQWSANNLMTPSIHPPSSSFKSMMRSCYVIHITPYLSPFASPSFISFLVVGCTWEAWVGSFSPPLRPRLSFYLSIRVSIWLSFLSVCLSVHAWTWVHVALSRLSSLIKNSFSPFGSLTQPASDRQCGRRTPKGMWGLEVWGDLRAK